MSVQISWSSIRHLYLWHKWHLWHIWLTLCYNIQMSIYANIGIKRSVGSQGIKITMWYLRQNVLKGSNWNFTFILCFLCICVEYPLYIWYALSKVDTHSLDFLVMFSHSVVPQKQHLGGIFFIFTIFGISSLPKLRYLCCCFCFIVVLNDDVVFVVVLYQNSTIKVC